MQEEFLFELINSYGYITFFFILCLGVIGLPIPNEVTVMTAGFAASLSLLNPVTAFIATSCGIISGLSVCYFLGRLIGAPITERLLRFKNMDKYLQKSDVMIEKYGQRALIISYFFAGVRNLVPCLVGMNKLPFKTFSLYSYSSGLTWTIIFFTLGYLFGDSIHTIALWVQEIAIVAGLLFLSFLVFLLTGRRKRRQKTP